MPRHILTALLLSLTLLCANASALNQHKLIFALDVIRHGDRTPTRIIPAEPHIWSEGLGQLTPEGMQQVYHLGENARKKYILESHLLPNQYQPGTVLLSSTDVERTLMSAQSFMLGLYPLGTGPYSDPKKPALPSAFQPIPIRHIKHKLVHVDSKKLEELMKKHVFSKQDWQEKNASLKKYYPRWSKATGIEINDLYQLIGLGDTLSIYLHRHIQLPGGLTQADANMIVDAGKWAMAAKYRPKKIGYLTAHLLLAQIGRRIADATQQSTPLKYALLSAHDCTILAILSVLEVPQPTKPSFAADINFAVYENGTNSYQVEVSYNGKPMSIPGCSGQACSLTQFLDIVNHCSEC